MDCSRETTEPPPDLQAVDLMSPPIPDMVVLACQLEFGPTWAAETTTSRILPPNGGTTDAASVVSVKTYAMPSAQPVKVIYDTKVADCNKATYPSAIVMNYAGLDDTGEGFDGIVPAYKAGTHVCWRIAASGCGGTVTNPPSGMPAFDYTTQ